PGSAVDSAARGAFLHSPRPVDRDEVAGAHEPIRYDGPFDPRAALQFHKECSMKAKRWRTVLIASLISTALMAVGGCGESARAKRAKARAANAAHDDHGAWWCAEHG